MVDRTPLEVARRKVARLPKLKGELTNEEAFEMLRLKYIEEKAEQWIADQYDHKVKRSFLNRIMSDKEGTDTSRLPAVRAIFKQMMLELGLPCPFVEYKSEKEEARLERKRKQKGLGVWSK
jgi:hypothetical protein